MGSYSELRLGTLSVDSAKNRVSDEHLDLFCESDRLRERRLGGSQREFYFSAPASVVAQRLDVRGYTLSRAREEHERGRRQLIRELTSSDFDWSTDLERWGALTYAKWIGMTPRLLRMRYRRNASFDAYERWLLDRDQDEGSLLGFQADFKFAFRALVATVPGTTRVVLDYSDCVAGNYIWPRYVRAPKAPRFIVMTEGTSDSRILQKALRLRHPGISPYYSFMDFDLVAADGGAPALVRALKTVVAAQLTERFIAVFDNDAAASSHLRALRGMKLPPNIFVMQLPSIPMAANYPVVGPNTRGRANVNGSAGSLELYFGKNILRLGRRTVVPVRWTSFIEPVGKYQGELANKRAVRLRFERHLDEMAASVALAKRHDWSGM